MYQISWAFYVHQTIPVSQGNLLPLTGAFRMQESFEILSSTGNYTVVVGTDLLTGVVAQYSDAIFMIDERLEAVLPATIARRIVIIANENNKSLECMPDVILKMRTLGANRTSHLVAIGGGVIQDIATFTASTYMRGIKWTYMPTTLLGVTDSCIGGKSSINVMGYKNLIGNFYPPVDILIDMAFIHTLNEEQVVGGLFEAAKICYARGYQQFLEYLNESPSFPMGSDNAQRVIVHVLKTKKWFIETDEFDQNERLLLNFGHTFGHALEAGTNFGITHGIAVGIGMVVAVEYAKIATLLSPTGISRAEHLIAHVKSMLGEGLKNVMASPPEIDLALVMEKFNNDKKHRAEFYRMVVPKEDGDLELISETKTDAILNRIRLSYQQGLSEIGYLNYQRID
jgi:3-dehydroquinate synthase